MKESPAVEFGEIREGVVRPLAKSVAVALLGAGSALHTGSEQLAAVALVCAGFSAEREGNGGGAVAVSEMIVLNMVAQLVQMVPGYAQEGAESPILGNAVLQVRSLIPARTEVSS